MAQHSDYRSAGVDLRLGDQASAILFAAAQRTWENRGTSGLGRVTRVGDAFRAIRFCEIPSRLKNLVYGLNFDGVGTKIELAERLGDHTGIPFDLLAMLCDDAAASFAEPMHIGTVLDMAKVDLRIVQQLADGLTRAANVACVSILNGELAELPNRVRGMVDSAYNWSGACFWFASRAKLSDMPTPVPGDIVLGVREDGFRSNGYSLIRRVFSERFGERWGVTESNPLIEFAARHSTIYTPFLMRLTGGVTRAAIPGVKRLVHITGGGLLGRMRYVCETLQLGADIDVSDMSPAPEMIEIQQIGRVATREAYSTWNMGVGFGIICADSAISSVSREADRFGFKVGEIGRLLDAPRLHIRYYDGRDDTCET